jgi:Periplasmic protease
MKFILRFLLIGIIINAYNATSQTTKEYHPIVLKAKETSLYAENVNWDKVNTKFVELTEDPNNLNEVLQFLVNSLGDKHAAFRSAKNQSIIVNYNKKIDQVDKRIPKFVNEVINDVNSKFEYKLLEGDIGYLKIVGISPGKVEENSIIIRKGLKELKNKGVEKWIVDLRFNGGGDMNPMISGLAPLIGDGFIGGSVDSKNNLHHEFIIKEGQFFDNNRLVMAMDKEPIINTNEKVAVLLSRYTISSGELVAVAFKGRKNTRFIGEKTAGYGWKIITDELIMCISESVFIDRN